MYSLDDVLDVLVQYQDECEFIEMVGGLGEFETLSDVIDLGMDWSNLPGPVMYWVELHDALLAYENDMGLKSYDNGDKYDGFSEYSIYV